MPYVFIRSHSLSFSYFCDLFWGGDSDDVRRVVTPPISELGTLAGIRFVLCPDEGPAPDYFVGPLRFDHIGAICCASF